MQGIADEGYYTTQWTLLVSGCVQACHGSGYAGARQGRRGQQKLDLKNLLSAAKPAHDAALLQLLHQSQRRRLRFKPLLALRKHTVYVQNGWCALVLRRA